MNEPQACAASSSSLARAICAFVVLVVGCASRPPSESSLVEGFETFGTSREGRPIRGVVMGSGPETSLLLGVIHGDEPLGGPLLERFAEHLGSHPELVRGKRVVIVPVLNPDGLARRTRTNARGVDLNRNLPAENWRPHPRHGIAPGSEPETRALLKILRQFRPARILAIHSPLYCVNFDGPAQDLAEAMAGACGYPVQPSIGYETPGSLGSYAGKDQGIPTITLELARDSRRSSIWAEMAETLLLFVSMGLAR